MKPVVGIEPDSSLPEPVPACSEEEWMEATGLEWPLLAVEGENIIDISSSSGQVSKIKHKENVSTNTNKLNNKGSQLRDTTGDATMASAMSGSENLARETMDQAGPDGQSEKDPDVEYRAPLRAPQMPLLYLDDEALVNADEPAGSADEKGGQKKKKNGRKNNKVKEITVNGLKYNK